MFRSSCGINVAYFPFDLQNCSLKFGSWTYHKDKVDLELIGHGANLAEYFQNSEWELVQAPAFRHQKEYACCPDIFVDITYHFIFRRMPLFYRLVFLKFRILGGNAVIFGSKNVILSCFWVKTCNLGDS